MDVPLNDIKVYLGTEIDDAAMVGLHGVVAAVDASVQEVARMCVVARRRQVLRQGTLSTMIQDFNERNMTERGVERLDLPRGQKLWRVGDCEAPFKLLANSRPDRLDVAVNGGQHLVGAVLFAYHWVIEEGDPRAGMPPRAGLNRLWAAKILNVLRPRQGKKKFGGNVAKLILENETPFGVPRGFEVRVLAV